MTPHAAAARALAALLFAFTLAACSQEITVRGNMADPDAVATIEPGKTTRSEVAQLLGSPSTVSSFRDRTWYYIGQKQTKFAFLDPNILERSVLVVQFNDQGTVEDTKLFTLDDQEYVEVVDRETPTEGREFGLLEQLLGNIGRFDSADSAPGAGGGSPAPGVPGL